MIPVWLASPIVRKGLIYVAIAAACLYGFKLWLNKHDSRIYQEGKEAMAIQMEKQKQTEWEAKDKELAADKQALEAKDRQLEQMRIDINRSLNDRLRAVTTAAKTNSGAVVAIPDSQLDAALRAVSRELAAQP